VTTPIRTSDRSYFKRCRQLWDFTSVLRQNLEPFQRAEALDFGTAIHAALECYYDPEAWPDVDAREKAAIMGFLGAIQKVEKLVVEGPLDFEIDFNEQRMLGLGMLDNYFKWAPAHDNFKPVYVEVEFEVPLYAGSVYQGRIDLIVEDDYGYWIVDHKTTAVFGATEWLVLDDQCASYAWALRRQLGLEVRGVIYNELRKKLAHPPTVLKNGTLSVSKSQETTYELYMATIIELGLNPADYDDVLEYYASDAAQQYFRRTKVIFNKHTLENVEKRILLEAQEMMDNPAIYPTPSRFNCTGCRFFAPCVALQEGADYETILSENYQRRTD
jgi:RecB family exonuclease